MERYVSEESTTSNDDDNEGVDAIDNVDENDDDDDDAKERRNSMSKMSTASSMTSSPTFAAPNNVDLLFQTIRDDDIDKTLSLLTTHLSSIYWQSPDDSPLTLAISLDRTRMALTLLAHVASSRDVEDGAEIVNRANCRGWTPLMIAAKNGNLDVVKALVSLGADVNAHAENPAAANSTVVNPAATVLAPHFSPLLLAALHGRREVARFLLRQPEVNLRSRYHDPTFQDHRDHAEPEATTTEEDASTNRYSLASPPTSKRGLTILHCVAKHATSRRREATAEIVADILETTPRDVIDARAVNGQTALHFACRENYVSLARELLRAGANINLKDECGRTPISYAFRHPYDNAAAEVGVEEDEPEGGVAEPEVGVASEPEREVTRHHREGGCLEEILRRREAQVNVCDRYSFSPIHIATMFGDFRAVKMLRNFGANLVVKDHRCNLPLHYAARDQMLNILEFLLEAEPSCVNARNKFDQTTPLLTLLSHSPPAVHRRDKSVLANCVKTLLSHGANADAVVVTNARKTPVDIAAKLRHWDCVRLMLLAGSTFCVASLRQALNAETPPPPPLQPPTPSPLTPPFPGDHDDFEEKDDVTRTSLTRDRRWCRRFTSTEPLKLSAQTRICIRRCVGDRLWSFNARNDLDSVPLFIKDYIMMKEELT